MTTIDAATLLGKTQAWVIETLQKRGLSTVQQNHQSYFGHQTARELFQFKFSPRVIVFQIVKGGTGKTSLVHEFAIRASLYGARVLCVDMDQQGNLTHALHQSAETLPVMVDVLADNHPIQDCIVSAAPGIDLIPSRFENAMLDEMIRLKKLSLLDVYRDPFQAFKNKYDVIVVDCPPSLGPSVAACALSADYLLAPVTPEKFALSGLDLAYQSIQELETSFNVSIPFGVVLNKYKVKTKLADDALRFLHTDPRYQHRVLKQIIRLSQEFPKAIANEGSIFEAMKPTSAKEDMDCFTQALLPFATEAALKRRVDAFSGALLVGKSIEALRRFWKYMDA